MKYCYIDVETTGVDPKKNGILQLAGEIWVDGVQQNSFNFLVKPFHGQEIEDQALEVTGITWEQIERDHREPREVYRDFLSVLGQHVNKYDKMDKYFFVAYNAAFDDAFIRQFFKLNGDNYFGSWFWWPSIDVAVLAAEAIGPDRQFMENFKLTTVASRLGVKAEGSAHDAMYDITITRMVHERIRTELR